MNKYTKLTEFEINKAVADKLGVKHVVNGNKVHEIVFSDSDDINPFSCEFDPCNNQRRAWEIMMKYNICVVKNMYEDYYDAYSDLNITEYYTEYKSHQSHEKLLVAAMLCFLELNK